MIETSFTDVLSYDIDPGGDRFVVVGRIDEEQGEIEEIKTTKLPQKPSLKPTSRLK